MARSTEDIKREIAENQKEIDRLEYLISDNSKRMNRLLVSVLLLSFAAVLMPFAAVVGAFWFKVFVVGFWFFSLGFWAVRLMQSIWGLLRK